MTQEIPENESSTSSSDPPNQCVGVERQIFRNESDLISPDCQGASNYRLEENKDEGDSGVGRGIGDEASTSSESGIAFTASSQRSSYISESSGETGVVDENSSLFEKASSSSGRSQDASTPLSVVTCLLDPRDDIASKQQPNGIPFLQQNGRPVEVVQMLDLCDNSGSALTGKRPGCPHKHFNTKKRLLQKLRCNCQCDLRVYLVLTVFFVTNLLNYMDRYTIAGVLIDVSKFYGINKADGGLLQTSFICSYMVLSPIFGYLGDRYNRKIIMAVGILFWSVVTLASSFIPQDMFPLFLFMRAMVGVGEASYSTIAPTIIADLFVKTTRTKALSLFYFAIPVGSGLGYIVGSKVAEAMGHWQWALRVTPAFGVVCVIMILFVVKEPSRGSADGGTHLHNTSYWQDLKYLLKNKTFMLTTAGFTCVAFVAGALALWVPTYMFYSIRVQPTFVTEANVALVFGIVTCAAGLIGVASGTILASHLRKRNPRADPLVCAFGLISSAPFIFLAIYMSKHCTWLTWVLIFLGETLLSLNWALVTDILLYIVIPTRRSSAEAMQILISHTFGDAGSPYIIGALADSLISNSGPSSAVHWRADDYLSLQYSMYITCFFCVLGGGFFLWSALYIQEDRARADKIVKHTTAAISRESSDESITSPGAPGIHISPSVVTTNTVVA